MKLGLLAFAELIMISASAGHDGLWGYFFGAISVGLIGIAVLYGTDCMLTWFVAIIGVVMTLLSLKYDVNSAGAIIYALLAVAIVIAALFLTHIRRQQDHDDPVY